MLYYLLYMIIILYVSFVTKRTLHMLQQNLYNENNRYLNWINKNYKITVVNYLYFAIALSVLNFFFNSVSSLFIIVIMIIYIVSYVRENNINISNQNKKPLVITARIKRLIITHIVIYALVIVFGIIFNRNDITLLILTILSTLSFYTTFLSVIINSPIEKLVYAHYESMAKNKLSMMKNLKVIGITGSYGKTSCKNILNDILSIKFNSLATPKSLNTFNGLMITINNKLDKFDDVFIAEMGAYVKGEINGLCDLVNPKYGIITSIGTAHLKTFGSEENIQKGKMELIEHLPCDGIGVLNRDDKKQVTYKIKNSCKIIWVGIESENVDFRAKNIKTKGIKTTFDIEISKEGKSYEFETKLLGKHNIYNILSAVALGYELGISIKDLQLAVKRVKSIEHRLELKRIGNFYQIDDAYNSNPVGAKNALEVLSQMDGYKVVVTPGMIELGNKEYEYNFEFGKQINEISSADLVILVGEKKTKPIMDGLIKSGYDKDKIMVINDVRKSYTIINDLKMKNVYALYENDLPDTYNE